MRVDGVGSNSAIAAKITKRSNPPKEEKPVEAASAQVTEKPESEEKTRGVIRLLQAGHFKGVADVRLRINFHEELQALESQNLKTAATGGFENLNQTIQDQITALKDSGLLDADQTAALDAFLEGLQSGQAEFLAADAGSLQGLIDGWKEKLDDLMALLNPPAPATEPQPEPLVQEVVPPQEPTDEPPADAVGPQEVPVEPVVTGEPDQQPPTEETAPKPAEITPEPVEALLTEPPVEEPSPLQQLVQGFQESVQQALDQMNADLTGTSVLPPISEPSGNGKAFAKFMAIYESMQAGNTPDLPEPELLDVEEVMIPNETEPLSQSI
jgi:hypothetical protein